MIETIAWVLPRPNKSKYVGSFPLHFETKLLKELGIGKNDTILHPFGGKAEFGLRCDINPATNPDIVCDAHNLPFKNDTFDLVILDPPYSDKYSKDLYKTGKLKFGVYTKEAVRVCKPGKYVVFYHEYAAPILKGTKLVKRIFMETRVWHKLRCIHIYQKDPQSEGGAMAGNNS
jgi:hypothetical protein